MAGSFMTYGPFELERTGGYVSPDELRSFWEKVTENYPGLDRGIGVYVMGTRRGGGSVKPWYVGRTDKGFSRRLRSHARSQRILHKLAEAAPRGALQIFLLGKIGSSGNLVGPLKKPISFGPELNKRETRPDKAITKLEFSLIGSCYVINKKLINVSGKKFHQSLNVPGYLNEKRGRPNMSARAFANMLNAK